MAGQLTKRQKEVREKLLVIDPGSTPSEVRARISELCQANGYDPVAELLLFVQTSGEVLVQEINEIAKAVKSVKLRERLEKVAEAIKHVGVGGDSRDIIGIHKEILQYIAPKLRSMEIKGDFDLNFNITVTKFAGAATNQEG